MVQAPPWQTHISFWLWGQQFCSCWDLLHAHALQAAAWEKRVGLLICCSSQWPTHDLELERLSSEASEVLHKLWERDRETDSLLGWFRLSGRRRFVGWKISLTKNNITLFFLFKKIYPKMKLFIHGTEVTILDSQWCVSVNVRRRRHVPVFTYRCHNSKFMEKTSHLKWFQVWSCRSRN